MKQRVSAVIMDLDNTLFDWLGMWHAAFSAMLHELVAASGVSQEQLESEFRQIHQRHGTSEYSFSIEELPSLIAKHPGQDLVKLYEPAVVAYRDARRTTFCAYAGVIETLETLKDKRCLLVGYTESMAFYTNRRLWHLGLDRILEYLYSPPDHDLPHGLTPNRIRFYPPEHYELRRTVHRHTPKGELKPNPALLLDIIKEVGATVGETVYVGDSLMKDVLMAQRASVTDVWAEYGAGQNRPEYELLRRVSHWSEADVHREKALLKNQNIRASYTLGIDNGFPQLLEMFNFAPFRASEQMSLIVDAWKTTIGVQQHFNDLELRIRNLAITLLLAVIGGTALALKENLRVEMFGLSTSLGSLLLMAGAIAWFSFYFMDRCWYHRLLYGAVTHAISIEKSCEGSLPALGLTGAIGRSSPIQIGSVRIRSPGKIDLFYVAIGLLIVLAAVVLFCSEAR